MDKYIEKFNELLLNEDRYGCIKYAEELLKDKKVSIVDLYEKILGSIMFHVGEMIIEEEVRIWQEHVYASIVRSVVENCYTYVVEGALKINNPKKVIVICPRDEYHEIGPRMVADFFMLLGHKVTYVGGNTPKEDFALAIKNINPDVVAISVSTNYNVIAAKDTIELIKTLLTKFKIVVGGSVFESNKEIFKQIGADYQAKTFEDIKRIGSEL